MDVEVSREGDTVDLIAFRRRKVTRGVTESILKLNPGLAGYGVYLPAGLEVKLPATPAAKNIRNVKRLWS